MNQWMAKVNEMKQLRQGGAPGSPTPTSTAAGPRKYPSSPTWRGNNSGSVPTTSVASPSSPRSKAATPSTSSSFSSPSAASAASPSSSSYGFRAGPSSLASSSSSSSSSAAAGGSASAYAPAPSLACKSGEELAREVALLRKQLEEAEREAASTKRELEDVKVKREEARKRLRLKQQQQIQSLKARPPPAPNPLRRMNVARRIRASEIRSSHSSEHPPAAMNSMQRQIGQKQQSLAAPPPGGSRVSSRQSTRASRRVSGGKVVSHITRVIQEMARLEATVTSAEEAQARAESELLEYAAERRKTEEALVAMQQQLEKVTAMLGSAIEEMRGDAQLVELLTEVKVGLNGCHMILTCKTLTLPTAGGAQGGATSSQQEKLARRRGMTFGATPAVPSAPAPPPPAPASSGFAPPPPPPAADVSLLSAIREGKQSADLQALRQKRASMRKSVVVVQSLTDTLREAMKMRNDAMMGGEDDDDEDEDDWLG